MRQLRSELTIEKLGRAKAEARVKDLLRRMFSPKSEKLNALQGLLFAAASATEQAAAATRKGELCASAAAKRLPVIRKRRRAPVNLPVLETERFDVPEAERVGLVWMRDEVTYEQDYQASQFFLRAIVRPVYGHPKKKLHRPRRWHQCRCASSRSRWWVLDFWLICWGREMFDLLASTGRSESIDAGAWISRPRLACVTRKNAHCCC